MQSDSKLIQNQQHAQKFQQEYKSNRKIQEYVEKKIYQIQETKQKTIKNMESYFSDLKQKINRYLIKEQKKILNSYQDIINKSLNCLRHSNIFNKSQATIFQIKEKNGKKPSQRQENFFLQQKYISENELNIKFQIKKVIQEMILFENYINEQTKLVSQIVKNELPKLISSFNSSILNIPILQNLNSENHLNDTKLYINKKDRKLSNIDSQRPQLQNRNFENLPFEKLNIIESVNSTHRKTQKLIRKQSVEQFSPFLNINKRNLKLIPLSKKDNDIILNSIESSEDKKLITFDLISQRSILKIYQINTLELRNQDNQNQIQIERINRQPKRQIFLNENQLIHTQNKNKFKFQCYLKILFQSKSNRDYLLILWSNQFGDNQNQLKNFHFTISNYKGDQITSQILEIEIKNVEKVIKMHQIFSNKQYFFIVFNNHIFRFNFMNNFQQKCIFFGLDEKIVASDVNEKSLVVFEAKKQFIMILNENLQILNTFNWRQMFPQQIQISKFISIRSHSRNILIEDESTQKMYGHNLNLILPKASTINTINYIKDGSIEKINIEYEDNLNENREFSVGFIKQIIEIDIDIYLILSQKNYTPKYKANIYLMQITGQADSNENQESQLIGKINYLQTIRQQIITIKYIKSKIYIVLKNDKTIIFSIV